MEPLPYIATYTNVPVLVDSPQKPKDPEITFPGILCNCYRGLMEFYGPLPRMVEIIPNTGASVGTAAIEWFGSVKHVSYVTEVFPGGVSVRETNFSHCRETTRFIPFNSHRLTGFWKG